MQGPRVENVLPAARACLHCQRNQQQFQHLHANITGSTVTATNHDHDGHNHDAKLGQIYLTMLNELNCTGGVSFSRFYCCGHQGHGLWPSWFVAVMV